MTERYPARHGIVWICGKPHTVTEAEKLATDFLDSAINAPGDHWRSGWGDQIEDLCRSIRLAKQQEADSPVREAA